MSSLKRRIEQARAFINWKANALTRQGGKYIAKQETRLENKVRRRFLSQMRWVVDMMAQLSFFQGTDKGVKRLERKTIESEIDAFMDDLPEAEELAGDLGETAGQTFKKGARDAHSKLKMAEVGVSFELVNDEAVQYLTRLQDLHLSNFKGSINRETRKRIISLLRDAAETGQSYTETSKKIQAQGESGVFSRSRAQMIAVNEVGKAYGTGNYEMVNTYIERTNAQIQKLWVTVGDGKVTPECQANEAREWIGYNEGFPSGDEFAPRQENPRCRCSTVYRQINMNGEEV